MLNSNTHIIKPFFRSSITASVFLLCVTISILLYSKLSFGKDAPIVIEDIDMMQDKLRYTHVLKFLQYIDNDWIDKSETKVTIAVYGDVSKELYDFYYSFQGHYLMKNQVGEILVNPPINKLPEVEVVYFSKFFAGDFKLIFDNLKTTALTIVDAPYYGRKETVIKIYKHRNKIRFSINAELAYEKNIVFNAKLLELGSPHDR